MPFLVERKDWLERWKEVVERDYPDFDHDINPEGLDLVKMGSGGNVMTNGCNTARKLDRLMVATIKAHYDLRKGQCVGAIITDSINEIPQSNSVSEDNQGEEVLNLLSFYNCFVICLNTFMSSSH